MPDREQVQRPGRSEDTEVEAEQPTKATKSETSDDAQIEDLLDEIDEVLETNAEEFVKSYVQKGGQ